MTTDHSGQHGLGIAPRHGEVVEFFAELGKLLMFFAGMEIDLVQFNRTRNRSIGFGLLTFALPFCFPTTRPPRALALEDVLSGSN